MQCSAAQARCPQKLRCRSRTVLYLHNAPGFIRTAPRRAFTARRELLQPSDIAAFEAFLCAQLTPGGGGGGAVLSPAHALAVAHAWVRAMRAAGGPGAAAEEEDGPQLAHTAAAACLAVLKEVAAEPGGGAGLGHLPAAGAVRAPAPGAGAKLKPGSEPKPAPGTPPPGAAPSASAAPALRPGLEAAAGAAARLLQLLCEAAPGQAARAAPAAWAAFWAITSCAPPPAAHEHCRLLGLGFSD
jgi:hypothetical protein